MFIRPSVGGEMCEINNRLGWFLGIATCSAIALSPNCASAQITPDGTLPNNSRVTTQDNIRTIEGGTQAGSNLFHSFQEFSVPTEGTAFFNNGTNIQNIFGRVTGGSVSNIDGIIRANGTANLFLINPNGIIFGRNASLDVKGSFVASTASSFKFADGTEFSALAPQNTPLLTVSVPLGLQYGVNPGSIQVQGDGQGIRTTTELIDTTSGLRVQPNQTLALVGGDINLEGATLKTAGGRIELGSVGDNSLVSLIPINKGFSLGYDSVQNFGNIQLFQQAAVDASGAGGGDVQVRGRRVTLTNGSQIEASTLRAERGGALVVKATELVEVVGESADGEFSSSLLAQTYPGATGDAGDLRIETGELLIQNGAQISASTFGSGKGGDLTVTATKRVQLIGISSGLFAQANPGATGNGGDLRIETGELLIQNGAGVSAATFGSGKGGDLRIETGELLIQNGAVVSVDTFGSGKGGDLTVTANKVQLIRSTLSAQANSDATGDAGDLRIETGELLIQNGAQVSASTFGSGKGGDLTVTANKVQLIGTSADGRVSSTLSAQANSDATGDAGDLRIETGELLIQNGAQVSASTFGSGKGGNLTVTANKVQLIGTSADGRVSSSLAAQANSDATGNGGDLTINTGELLIQNGAQVSAATFAGGKGGNLTVTANKVQLIGISANGRARSGLIAGTQGTGKAGDLTITTQQLLISDGAEATVSSRGKGEAGNLGITAHSVRLDNGKITAQTRSGNGGNLNLNVADLLLMRRGSEISTTAGRAEQGGDGGNITINTPNGFIVAVPSENSDITANAYTGTGGRVQINAFGIYGTQFREKQNSQISDITASSEFGVNGTVELNTPDIDLNSALINLPSVPIDTKLAQGCNSPNYAQSSFIVTGRGGLPPNPRTDLLTPDAVEVDWVTLNPNINNRSTPTVIKSPTITIPEPIVEATGWVRNEKGEVVLTANAPTITPHESWQKPAPCRAS